MFWKKWATEPWPDCPECGRTLVVFKPQLLWPDKRCFTCSNLSCKCSTGGPGAWDYESFVYRNERREEEAVVRTMQELLS